MNNNMTSAQARNHFPDLVSQAIYAKKRTIITRRGKKAAAIIPIEDLDRLLAFEDQLDLEDAREALEREEFIDWELAKKDLMKHFGSKENDIQN